MSAPQAPEQVRIFIATRAHELCVGGDDIHPDNVIGRPSPSPREVADSAAEGQPRNAGERDEAENGCQPVQLRLAIDVSKDTTRLHARHSSVRIDPYAAHERHVEHEGTVGDGQARDVVSAALDAKQQLVLARKPHALDDVGDADAASDHGGSSVDHAVPDGP